VEPNEPILVHHFQRWFVRASPRGKVVCHAVQRQQKYKTHNKNMISIRTNQTKIDVIGRESEGLRKKNVNLAY
jgi:hypothetical protein